MANLFCVWIVVLAETMKFVDETVAGQTKQVMDNMGEILKAAGATYGDVVKTTILLAEIVRDASPQMRFSNQCCVY